MNCECGMNGLKVKKITVGSHVNPEYWHLIDDDFYACQNPECDIVYFNKLAKFTLNQVKTRVFFKATGSSRPLCYCKQVTEEDVLKTIEEGARSVEEVEKVTELGDGKFCVVTNPLGRCCKEYYTKFINKHLSIKERSIKKKLEMAEEEEKRVDSCCT